MKPILTFDYELFFGPEAGDLQNTVLGPTEQLLKLLNEYKSTSVFFVDASWLHWLSIHDNRSLKKIQCQLAEITKYGHTIELHVHPHWQDAKLISGRIEFTTYENFRCCDLPENSSYLTDCTNILLETLSFTTQNTLTCFRAGGYCAYPHGILFQTLYNLGIKRDSSFAPGAWNDQYPLKFDYRELQEFKPFDIELGDGVAIREVPIFTYRLSTVQRLYQKALRVASEKHISKIPGRGLVFNNSFTKKLRATTKIATPDNTKYNELPNFEILDFSPVLVGHPKNCNETTLKTLRQILTQYHGISNERFYE